MTSIGVGIGVDKAQLPDPGVPPQTAKELVDDEGVPNTLVDDEGTPNTLVDDS